MMQTPWGPSQYVRKVADGIQVVSTAGHGGYHLSPARQMEFKNRFPKFKTFVGSLAWFEEDCDAAAIAIAFPQYFEPSQVEIAKQMVSSMSDYFAAINEVLAVQ